MGAYLSEPNVETISEDGESDRLSYGASAMQGWRVAMEDSHNCITKLDDDTSLFAVYDGHGGAEVAIYTAQQLPKLLTDIQSFKDGDIEAALRESFMVFDASLKTKAIIEKLRRIAGVEAEEEKEEDGETDALLEEAELPLEQLVARYCTHPSKTQRSKLKQSHPNDLLSPVIHKTQPRFPLTVENGSLQDGEGPVPNKTVPFDSEGDIVPKATKKEEGSGEGVNGPGGDCKKEGENGMDSDDDEDEEEEEKTAVKKEAEPIKMEAGDSVNGAGSRRNGEEPSKAEKKEEEEVKEEEAGSSGSSGSCNGSASHSKTKDTESTSGSSLGSKLKLISLPDDDDSDEDDEDYNSEEEEEEEEDEDEDEEDEEEEEEEEDDGEEVEQEEYEDEEEEDFLTMQQGREEPGSDSGSTAVVAVLRGMELIVGNIGDSRCVLSRGGKAHDMSYDHKPEDDIELRRIENAGGKVTPDGRVNGGLNLSRAFGDHCYKRTSRLPPEEQMISAFPDIQTATLTDKDDFMVIACDGIWNAMTSQEVIDFVQQRLDSTAPPKSNRLSKICEEMFDFCLAPDTTGDGTGCDNMTCLIVEFHHNENGSVTAEAATAGKRKSKEDCAEENDSKKPRH